MNERREWNRIDRKKRVFDRFYTNEFMKALFKQIDPILENFDLFQLPSDVINAAEKIKKDPIQAVFIDLYNRVGLDFIKDTVTTLKGASFEFETKNDGMQTLTENPEAFTWIWSTEVNSWVLQNVGDRIVTITETSRARAVSIIRQIVKEAQDEGLSIPNTMKLIEHQIPISWRKELWRAETIARTEVLSASNEGAMRGAKATGLDLNKQWLTRLDGRERMSHRAANGQTVDANEKFRVGDSFLKQPGDINGSAEEVINCRCVMRFIRK